MKISAELVLASLKSSFTLLLVLCAVNGTYSQRRINNIALDRTVLDFSTGALKTFELPSITDVKYRYMSTICSPSGRLDLISLCTLGPTSYSILDRTGKIMPHGAVPLDAECNLIVPNPCDSNIYYVFIQTENRGDGLAYITVDMKLNGGLGDVVTGSQTTLLLRELTDNIFATPMANGEGYWVMVHDYLPMTRSTDSTYGFTYFAYKVTANGVDPNPVMSRGPYCGPSGDDEWPSCVSPDGKSILYPSAHIARRSPSGWFGDEFAGGELMSFDPSTGKITHRQLIPVPMGVNGIYNAVFSPDGSKLYLSLDGPDDLGQIVQLDLSSGDSATIVNSMTSIAPEAGRYISGADGKIYAYATIANPRDVSTDVKVINAPNALGAACNYQSHVLELGRLMWNAASVEEVSRFLESNNGTLSSFWSARIINDSNLITIHLPVLFRHLGAMSGVDMIMHYPTDGSLKFLGTSLYNGKSFDVSGSQWAGRVALHFDAADLNAAPDSILGYVNFQWTPFELDCDYIDFDSLQTAESSCAQSDLAAFQGIIGSYATCGLSSVAEDANEQTSFTIYPNPAERMLEVQFGNATAHRYELFDALGITRKHGISNGNTLTIDVSDLSNGSYYLRVMTSIRNVITEPVVIRR